MRARPSGRCDGGRELKQIPPALLSFLLIACPWIQAKPAFIPSQITGRGTDVMICDLDGDGLKDIVLMDDTNLSIFYQDPKTGFSREPQQSYSLDPRPCLVWTAKLGGPAESVLVMNSDGVDELRFTNRTGRPLVRQILRQPTIIPDAPEATNAIHLSLSAETAGHWPLLLVPATDGLQVWSASDGAAAEAGDGGQHRGEWHRVQVIGKSVDTAVRPLLDNPGYGNSLGFDLSVADVNGDGRDDLMIRRGNIAGTTNTYTLYLQQTNGGFGPEPASTYEDQVQPFSWLCWVDLNRDGNVDLIKSVWLNEPSFAPGIPSGKVLVSTYIADAHGRIPPKPRQVFRKDDWVLELPVWDLDGDGLPDLVLGYFHMDSREGLRKEITARQLDYSLRFFFSRPGSGFPREADFQSDVVLHLDGAEGPMSWGLPQHFARCIQLGGDFNGDGKKDLLVREHADDISVYFFVSRQEGFSREPDLRFTCPEPMEDWQVADLNGDGISDLIVKLARQKGFRIFISRK